MRWPRLSIAAAPVDIIDGDRGKEYPKQSDFQETGYCLFLNTGNVRPDGFDFSNCQFISDDKDRRLRKGRLTREDLVMTTRGTIGNIAYFDENVPYEQIRINSGMVIFRANHKRLLPSFLYHFFRSSDFIGQTNSLRSGAAQPQLPIRDINQIELPLPDVSIQKRIASILSTYDNLIENNRRRMALLEDAARQVYQEWFVRLRFPGYEHTRIVDGVPEGWERKGLGEVANINKTNIGNSFDGELEYIDIASVSPGAIDETTTYDFRDAPSRARRVVKHGDIIWSCVRPNRRSHAIVWQPPENMIASTGFAVISPLTLPTSYLYQSVTTELFVGYLGNHAKGAAYPAVVAGDFERAEVLVPSQTLLNAFNEIAEPMITQTHNLRQQNQKLRTARDLLLPKLMSGEIAV